MQLRLGTFKLNWVAIDVSFFFVLGFILYFGGYAHFLNLYLKMYYQAGDSPLKSIQWFLVGWPIVMLLVTIGLCLLASFESRQLLLAVRQTFRPSLFSLFTHFLAAYTLLEAHVDQFFPEIISAGFRPHYPRHPRLHLDCGLGRS